MINERTRTATNMPIISSRSGLPSFEEWRESIDGPQGFIDNYDLSTSDLTEYVGWLIDDETEDMENVLDYVEQRMQDDYYSWFEKYESLRFPLTLYRCVGLDPNKDKWEDIRDIGIYWTDRQSLAKCYWGKHTHEQYILITRVDEDQIDWFETLEVNMRPELGIEEQEIRLFEGETIPLVGMIFPDGSMEYLDFTVKT